MMSITTAESWLSLALDAARQADEQLVLAALRLLCLQAHEDHPTAVAIELEWSDQGDFLSVVELISPSEESIEWEDDNCLAWNFTGNIEHRWAPFMTTETGNRFRLAIAGALAAIADPPAAGGLAAKVDQVIARSEQINAEWAEVSAGDVDPPAGVWQADDDARRDLSYDAVEVLHEVRAALTFKE